jgi:hypothetical protein
MRIVAKQPPAYRTVLQLLIVVFAWGEHPVSSETESRPQEAIHRGFGPRVGRGPGHRSLVLRGRRRGFCGRSSPNGRQVGLNAGINGFGDGATSVEIRRAAMGGRAAEA